LIFVFSNGIRSKTSKDFNQNCSKVRLASLSLIHDCRNGIKWYFLCAKFTSRCTKYVNMGMVRIETFEHWATQNAPKVGISPLRARRSWSRDHVCREHYVYK
jgi:hypothetical protein